MFDFGPAEYELKQAMLRFVDFMATKKLTAQQKIALGDMRKVIEFLPHHSVEFVGEIQFYTEPSVYSTVFNKDSKAFMNGLEVTSKWWCIAFYGNILEVYSNVGCYVLPHEEDFNRLNFELTADKPNWFKTDYPSELRYGQAEWMEEVNNLDRYVEEGWDVEITIDANTLR